jgi:hypothetical protein
MTSNAKMLISLTTSTHIYIAQVDLVGRMDDWKVSQPSSMPTSYAPSTARVQPSPSYQATALSQTNAGFNTQSPSLYSPVSTTSCDPCDTQSPSSYAPTSTPYDPYATTVSNTSTVPPMNQSPHPQPSAPYNPYVNNALNQSVPSSYGGGTEEGPNNLKPYV